VKALNTLGLLVLGVFWTIAVIVMLWVAWLFIFMPFGPPPKESEPVWPLVALAVAGGMVWLTPLAFYVRKRRRGNKVVH
jgi:RsiW-degrading membrane proteinase PrsW (M82 family)